MTDETEDREANDETNAAFARIGNELATIFTAAVQHATETAGEPAGAVLAHLFRAGRLRAVMGLGRGEISFELWDDDGEWHPIATLRADAPPELH